MFKVRIGVGKADSTCVPGKLLVRSPDKDFCEVYIFITKAAALRVFILALFSMFFTGRHEKKRPVQRDIWNVL